MFAAGLLAFFLGFLSLGQEILWIRLFSFANHSLPQAFSFVLTIYLLGIGFGALIGKKLCQNKIDLWEISGITLIISGCFDLISPYVYATFSQTSYQVICAGIIIFLTALLKAIIFPITHHIGVTSNNIGKSVSRIYFANIMGASLGPAIFGLLLLDLFTLQQCFFILAFSVYIIGLYCLFHKIRPVKLIAWHIPLFSLFLVIIIIKPNLLIAKIAIPAGHIKQIIEDPHGIVTIYTDINKNYDVIFGGNVYDGNTNLNPIINSNHINRVIILSVLNQPERVLMIGLSIGSWLKLLTTFPSIRYIDVIEINPAYLKAIKNYPSQQSALFDPRVHVYIDDGRRWLNIHPEKQYDLIVMNTTYYWRAYSSNLLSKEFLTLIKKHMKPSAIFAYNTTNSIDAFKTADHIFQHAYKYENFVIAADFDWRSKLLEPIAIKKLSMLQIDGALLFPMGSKNLIQKYLNEKVYTYRDENQLTNSLIPFIGGKIEIITDDNVITEYKHGLSL